MMKCAAGLCEIVRTDPSTPAVKDHQVTTAALDVMTDAIIQVEDFARQVEAAGVCRDDRDALLRATSAIAAQADWVIAWLLAAPLEGVRH